MFPYKRITESLKEDMVAQDLNTVLKSLGIHTSIKGWKRRTKYSYLQIESESRDIEIVIDIYRFGVNEPSVYEINSIVVKGERGKGLGGSIIDAIFNVFKKHNIKDINIHIDASDGFWDHIIKKYPNFHIHK